jgi:trigger factor
LVETANVSLPDAFLERWLRYSGETVRSEEEAKIDYKNSKEGIIYQLIQQQMVKEYELKVEFQEVREFALKQLKSQLTVYGQFNFEQEQLDSILDGALKNKEEYQRVSDQAFALKLLELYKQNVAIEIKEVNFDEFIGIVNEKAKKS